MWVLFPLTVLLGGSCISGGVGLVGEGIVGIWYGLRAEFGQGFLFLEAIFSLAILPDDSFGPLGLRLRGEGVFDGGMVRRRGLIMDSPECGYFFH